MQGFPVKPGDITPQMLMSQIDPSSGARPPMHRFRRESDQPLPPGSIDRSASLLSRATWQPSPESDTALLEKLNGFNSSIRPHGRATLAQGLGVSRVLGDVVLERMPDGLRAIADEAENDVEVEKKEERTGRTGLPGQKKRKVQELAETIDKALVIDKEVETVSDPAFDIACRIGDQPAEGRVGSLESNDEFALSRFSVHAAARRRTLGVHLAGVLLARSTSEERDDPPEGRPASVRSVPFIFMLSRIPGLRLNSLTR
jgi:hypothetical protein